jgi:hypothetical protein
MALAVGPTAWVLLAFGQGRSSEAFTAADHGGVLHAHDITRSLLFLAAAGLLLGVVGALRLSPLGASLIGIVYTSSYTLLLVAPERLIDLFNTDLTVGGRHADLSTPMRTGTSLVLGVLLLVASISVGRRHSPRRTAQAAVETVVEPDHPVGIDGLGVSPSYPHAEPEPAVRYTNDPRYYPAEPDPRYRDDATSSSWATRASRTADHRW